MTTPAPSPGIFILNGPGDLIALAPTPYETEANLQELLATHPELLVGDQIDPESPRRWLLIRRELAVPGEEGGGGRWSLDHLFLDQDAVPTLIEVKRSSDTRSRREVVAQMLDYAANGVAFWPVETLRTSFEERERAAGRDPDEVLSAFLGSSNQAAAEFWQQVKTNLQAGRVRMVFVADEIPAELRRIVEFLNSQMDPAEVLAVEVRHYAGAGFRGLVPRVIGQSEHAKQKKAASTPAPSRQWDQESVLAAIEESTNAVDSQTAHRLVAWGQGLGASFWCGKGATDGSMYFGAGRAAGNLWPFSLWTNGKIEVHFQYLKVTAPFDDIERRRELARRLNEIPGVAIPEDALARRPGVWLSQLREEASFRKFCTAMEWAFQLIRAQER